MNLKFVIIIDPALPSGLIANTAAVLSMTVAARYAEIVGHDTPDADDICHAGITSLPIPVLRADREQLFHLHARARHLKPQGLFMVDFSTVAQRSASYAQYADRMRATASARLSYLGLALCGPPALTTSLTGSLPLLR